MRDSDSGTNPDSRELRLHAWFGGRAPHSTAPPWSLQSPNHRAGFWSWPHGRLANEIERRELTLLFETKMLVLCIILNLCCSVFHTIYLQIVFTNVSKCVCALVLIVFSLCGCHLG